MKPEIILKKVIEKAVRGGWKLKHINKLLELSVTELKARWVSEQQINTIIFSHDFCKAFFGEEVNLHQYNDIWDSEVNAYEHSILTEWSYQLQQMVLQKEPLKYLEKFL